MYSRIREQFSTSALILSMIALVFAATGGAYAASNSGDGSKATASAKAKKGPRGPRGLTGPTGPVGPQGPAGAKGDTGAGGTNGTPGKDGKDGKSAKVTEVELGDPECGGRGGAIVGMESETGTEICNGEEGEPGEDGSPWTAGGTLPPGATETGAWAFAAGEEESVILTPISFSVPLKEELLDAHVHFQPPGFGGDPDAEAFEDVCGSMFGVGEPTADPGELCVYYGPFGGVAENATFKGIFPISSLELQTQGTSTTGANLAFTYSGSAGALAKGAGSWAVTGCTTVVGQPNQCP
jgi:hypothetical protein